MGGIVAPGSSTLTTGVRSQTLGGQVSCAASEPGAASVLLGTRDGYLVRAAWAGAPVDSVCIDALLPMPPGAPADGLAAIAVSPARLAYAVVLSSGRAAVLRPSAVPSGAVPSTALASLRGEWLSCCAANGVLAFSTAGDLLAVGMEGCVSIPCCSCALILIAATWRCTVLSVIPLSLSPLFCCLSSRALLCVMVLPSRVLPSARSSTVPCWPSHGSQAALLCSAQRRACSSQRLAVCRVARPRFAMSRQLAECLHWYGQAVTCVGDMI